GENLLSIKELTMPLGENILKQFFTVDQAKIDILGKVSRAQLKSVMLKLGNTQYVSQPDPAGNYAFRNVKLAEGDNDYSISGQLASEQVLLNSGFITLKTAMAKAPLIAIGKDGNLYVSWLDNKALVFKRYMDGSWAKEVYTVAANTMSSLGAANISVDTEDNVYFVWVENKDVFWRSYALANDQFSMPLRIEGKKGETRLNPKFSSTVSDLANSLKPLAGFEIIWLKPAPTANIYKLSYRSLAAYAPFPPVPGNIAVEKVAKQKIKISWNLLAEQAGYQIIMTRGAELKLPYFYDSGYKALTLNYQQVPVEVPDGSYYVWVRLANKNANWGAFSPAEAYTVADVEVPSPLLNPLAEYQNKNKVQLAWKTNVAGDQENIFWPDRYEVVCASDADFQKIIARNILKGNHYYFQGLPDG
ncbi:MAG: hypothetical protein WC838_01340, partial [Candidatus Margulisiibacteriota bacterium]